MQANDPNGNGGVTEFMEPATGEEIRRLDREEREGVELAFEIATTDPTETDHLTAAPGIAARRFTAAAAELLRAGLALVLSFIGRLLLASAARAVRARSSRTLGRVELSVLTLREVLEGRLWRRLPGRMGALRMMGARRRVDADAATMVSLKVAERRYLSGRRASGLGYTTAADARTVRVMLGVCVRRRQRPLYRVRRFMELEPGRFTEMAGYYATDPEAAFAKYLSNPSIDRMNAESQGENAADASGEQTEDTADASEESRAA